MRVTIRVRCGGRRKTPVGLEKNSFLSHCISTVTVRTKARWIKVLHAKEAEMLEEPMWAILEFPSLRYQSIVRSESVTWN